MPDDNDPPPSSSIPSSHSSNVDGSGQQISSSSGSAMENISTASSKDPTFKTSLSGYQPKDSSANQLCRNILIYGFCKYQDKGCKFKHERDAVVTKKESPKKKFNVDTPAFSPRGATKNLSKNASEFVPSTGSSNISRPSTAVSEFLSRPSTADFTYDSNKSGLSNDATSSSSNLNSLSSAKLNPSSPAFTPAAPAYSAVAASQQAFGSNTNTSNLGLGSKGTRNSSAASVGVNAPVFIPKSSASNAIPTSSSLSNISSNYYDEYNSSNNDVYQTSHPLSQQHNQVQQQQQNALPSQFNDMSMNNINEYSYDYSNNSSNLYNHNHNATYAPLQYHLYAPLPPHKAALLPHQRAIHNFFISDDLRDELQRKSEASLQLIPNLNLPELVNGFHSLVPLDTNNSRTTQVFGYVSWIYKATSSRDGRTYALRRLEGFKLQKDQAIAAVEKWKAVVSSGIVSCHSAFTTHAFNDSSIVFVYDYHPLASTLFDSHEFWRKHQKPNIPEQTIWTYLTQLATSVKIAHSNGLAVRKFDLSKILVTSKNRIRLNSCAIFDVIDFEKSESLEEQKARDIESLGHLMLSLLSGSAEPSKNLNRTLEVIAVHYSERICNIVERMVLSNSQERITDIDKLMQLIAGDLGYSMNLSLLEADVLRSELMGELENARLFRLITKLGFINERPEFEHDPRWSETGDRYMIKLFRDYVFHQVDEDGHPVIDLVHVIKCLNKV